MKKRSKKQRRTHSTPLVQVVELGTDMWCDHCGKVLDLAEFSPFTAEGIDEQFARLDNDAFRDQFGHGLS